MIYIVDIDGVICTIVSNGYYEKAEPIKGNIAKINKLYDDGNYIILWTARGDTTKIDWQDLTRKQLEEWGVEWHELRFNKPHYDVWIDDKAVRIEDL